MKTVHYFKHGKKHYLIISTTTRPVGEQIEVVGKVEARQLAKAQNAVRWNF